MTNIIVDSSIVGSITSEPPSVAPTVILVLHMAVADPAVVAETLVAVADPAVVAETLVAVADPAVVAETLVAVADPAVVAETLVAVADPAVVAETLVAVADPAVVAETPVVIVDAGVPVIVQNLVPTPQAPVTGDSGLLSYAFSNIVLTNHFFTTTVASGFGISAVSQKAGGKVSEIGIFAVDDATGKIGGIAPGAAGYLKAIGNSARSIFSTLGSSFFDSSSKREIALEPNKIYGFFEVQDGSIADLQQQLISGKVSTNILSSIPDDKGNVLIKVTNNDITGGYNVSVNNDELVLSVVKLDGAIPNVAIGAKSQGLAEGRTIDLTGLTGTLKADITTKSSAAFKNNIGFYVVEDSIGTIRLADGVTTLKPTDVGYAAEAIKNAILQTGKTESKTGQGLTGGKIYAPVVVSQGSFDEFIANNSKNVGGDNAINAYFNYVGANSDGKDHFRLIGDNTFGVEDQYGGGDRDFNDLVVNVKVK